MHANKCGLMQMQACFSVRFSVRAKDADEDAADQCGMMQMQISEYEQMSSMQMSFDYQFQFHSPNSMLTRLDWAMTMMSTTMTMAMKTTAWQCR